MPSHIDRLVQAGLVESPNSMPSRVFAVFSAASLVGAFALMSLMPPDLPLGHALLDVPEALALLHRACDAIGPEAWAFLTNSLLSRPSWFIPTALGLICGGIAYSLRSRNMPQPHRTRS